MTCFSIADDGCHEALLDHITSREFSRLMTGPKYRSIIANGHVCSKLKIYCINDALFCQGK